MSRIALIIAVLIVAGCSNQGLRDLRSNTGGPDEFMVLPSKPLSAPESYSELPPPTPGGANLTDPQPVSAAVAALGGRAGALVDQGVPSSDSALVSYASRNGVPTGVRETLAEEDAAFRKRRGRLTQFRLFPEDRYRQVYDRQLLDSWAEERRFRRAGIATPSAPPENP